MSKLITSKRQDTFLPNTVSRFSAVVFLFAMVHPAEAANIGNISAAVKTLIVGAIVAVLISLVFALNKNQEGKLVGIKTGKFFLIVSILLMIVLVSGAAAFFIFM